MEEARSRTTTRLRASGCAFEREGYPGPHGAAARRSSGRVRCFSGRQGPRRSKAPSAAQVRLHRFNSCPALVSYAQTHLKVTHGYPGAADRRARRDGRDAGRRRPRVSSGRRRRQRRPRPPAAPARRPRRATRPRTTRRRGSTSPTSPRPTARRSSRSPRGSSRPIAVGGARPKLVGHRSTSAPGGYGAQLLLRGNRLIVISGQTPRSRSLPRPIAAARRRRSAPRRTSPTAARRRRSPRSTSHDPSAMKVTQTMTVDGRFVDARQSRLERADRDLLGAAGDRSQPQLAGASTRLGADLALPGRPHRAPLHAAGRRAAATIRRPGRSSPGSGCSRSSPSNFDKGLGAAHSDSLMADAQIVYGSPTSLYVATQKWVNPALSVDAAAGRRRRP